MLPLRHHYANPALANAFRRPTSPIPYDEAPEVAAVRTFPADPLSRLREMEVRQVGRRRRQSRLQSMYPPPADFRIYELRDVVMCRNVLYSRDGRFFPDSGYCSPLLDGSGFVMNVCSRYRGDMPFSQSVSGTRSIMESCVSLGADRYALPRPEFPDGEMEVVEEPCYFFHSTINGHYGHFLVETVPKLWAAEELEEKVRLWVGWSRQARLLPDLLAAAIPFGFGRADFLTTRETVLFKKMYLASACHAHARFTSERALAVFRRIADYYAPSPDSDSPKRIYVSRRGDSNRMLVNEAACEEAFRRHGFTVVHPERLDWREQMRLFSNATHLAGQAGSAMHRRLFAHRLKKTLYLVPVYSPVFYDYLLNDAAFGKPSYTIFGEYAPQLGAEELLEAAPYGRKWKIDADELEAGIHQWLHD